MEQSNVWRVIFQSKLLSDTVLKIPSVLHFGAPPKKTQWILAMILKCIKKFSKIE